MASPDRQEGPKQASILERPVSNTVVLHLAACRSCGLAVAVLLVVQMLACGRTSSLPDQKVNDASVTPSQPCPVTAAVGTVQSAPRKQTPPTAIISGHVRDENGTPVSGAQVTLRDRSEDVFDSVVTDATGSFSAEVSSTHRPYIVMFASHDDFGDQWTGFASPGWRGFWRAGPMPETPVDLVLRRGTVLRGRAVDTAGRAFACGSLMLVPEYNGSGPPRIEAKTDGDGHFAFRRAVLENFELVPHSLDYWRPTTPGNYLRITQVPQSWVATARAGGSIDIRVEPYTVVPASIDVSALHVPSVRTWTRWSSGDAAVQQVVNPTGHVHILMEQGISHELWVSPAAGQNWPAAPWRRGVSPNWIGTPTGPVAVTISQNSTRPVQRQSVGPQTVMSEDAKRLLTTLRQRLDEIATASKSVEGLKARTDLDLRPLLGLRRQTLRDALGLPSVNCRDKPAFNVTTGERGRIAPCQADDDLAYSFYRLPKLTAGGGPELLLQFNQDGTCARARWRSTQ